MAGKHIRKKRLKWQRVLIATFSPWKNGVRLPINGNFEPMRDYFVPRSDKVVLIDQVYPGSDFVIPRVEEYVKGKPVISRRGSFILYVLYPFLVFANTGATHISFKIRDFLSVVTEGMRARIPYDIFIGFEAINALAGVLLRSLGKVKTVVYYVSDYSPKRYKAKWFNALYLWLDRQAATRADVIWDVSKAMMPARIQAGLDPEKSAPVLHVPNALYPKQIRALPYARVQKNTVVFLGTLGVENGPDIAIEAIAKVRKSIPDIMLHIIGGGEGNEARLKALAASCGIAKQIVFHGFVSNREEISNIARKFQLGLAPYKYIEGSARLYGDATKIRAYLAAGLPVITTHVPPLGRDASEAGAAMIVEDTPQAFADAIIRILKDATAYQSMRRAAIRYARNNTWEKEFSAALLAMGE